MEGSSGLIVAFVVALWAAYFVPLVLRRYDEASKNASLDVAGPLRTTVFSRARTQAAPPAPQESTMNRPAPAPAPRPTINREASRIAARRRRNTLLTLLGILAVVVGVAVAGLINVWWVAAPVALIAAWLVACRLMVRNERGLGSVRRPDLGAFTRGYHAAKDEDADASEESVSERVSWWRRTTSTLASVRTARPARLTAADEEPTIVVSHQFEEYDPDRPHVMEHDAPLEANALDEELQIAVPSVEASSGQALWDPLPVTVPTYVTKPRVGRTVRTIDFTQPGTWTSGHVEGEQTELPDDDRHDDSGPHRQAVGH